MMVMKMDLTLMQLNMIPAQITKLKFCTGTFHSHKSKISQILKHSAAPCPKKDPQPN